MNDLTIRDAGDVALSSAEIGLLVPPETAPLPAIDSVRTPMASFGE